MGGPVHDGERGIGRIRPGGLQEEQYGRIRPAYICWAMTSKEIKAAIAAAVAKVPEDAPKEMLQHVLDAIEALIDADKAKLERMDRFMKILEEDRGLLTRLAQ